MPLFQARSTFDSIVARGSAPLGTFITSTDANTTLAAGAAGFDFVVVDGEHGPLDVGAKLQHVIAAKAQGIVPILRVLENNPALIQQSLDLGAGGVIVPKVGTAEQAERAVRAGQYRPGGRGMCPAVPGALWDGSMWKWESADSNANTLVIPLIETGEGLRNAKEIAAVDGVDYLFFGLADLSQDIGIDMLEDADQLVKIWAEFLGDVHAAGVRAGAPLGYGFVGADFGTAGSDLMSWREACEANVARFRGGLA